MKSAIAITLLLGIVLVIPLSLAALFFSPLLLAAPMTFAAGGAPSHRASPRS
jgi:hypothetical protein